MFPHDKSERVKFKASVTKFSTHDVSDEVPWSGVILYTKVEAEV